MKNRKIKENNVVTAVASEKREEFKNISNKILLSSRK